ncbi:putative BPI/LBP family protein [Camellia lanceoleosa]|uniref:BPI/LBP family protein n=1 Tax=Camellia lanceoleosa TaxID=1840588 RepID=A0ACC0GZ19_9ERIC|nr:putative BPI/LBP family protein [Camellia lanceoleosa]
MTPLEVPQIEKPVKIPVVGTVHITLSNIVLYQLEVPNSTAKSGDTEIKDKGVAAVEVKGMEIGLTLGLKNQQGTLELSLLQYGCHVEDISIKMEGGASWLYQGIVDAFDKKIRSQIEDAISEKIEDGIIELDSSLQSLPKEVAVDKISALNVTFVNDLVFSNSFIGLEIDGLFTTRDEIKASNHYSRNSLASVPCEGPAKMVGISIHENVLNSASLVYFNADVMHWIVDEIPDQFLLNTAEWRHVLPQLYNQYPNDEMNMNISITSPPIIKVTQQNIDAEIYSDLTIDVLDVGKVIPVACISVVINLSGYPEISRNNLAGSVKLNDLTLSLKWSTIGSLHIHLLQPAIEAVLKTVLVPYVNLLLWKGVPLPDLLGYTLHNAKFSYIDSRIIVCSDIASLEQHKLDALVVSLQISFFEAVLGIFNVYGVRDMVNSDNLTEDDAGSIVGEKRPAENREDVELGVPLPKKARNGGGLVGNVKKVAEIVLVLAAMGKMRGGRNPTAAEKEMMAEARVKLSEVCEEFSPKDVFPRDAFGAVIEDLGLSKLREQRLGFRPPKMSIADKLLITKQKRLQKNSGAVPESHRASHTTRMFPSDKPNHALISSGGFQPCSPLGVSAANSTSLPYQLPASEVRTSSVSSGLPTNLPGGDSSSSMLPRVERPHFRLDPRSNGSSHTLQIQANSSGDHALLKPRAWSSHPQSASSGKTGPDNKVLPHQAESTANLTTSRMAPQATTSKPLITQTTSGHLPTGHQHVPGMNFVQVPLLSNTHSEIGKIVQKLLQPQLPLHPTWTPPSRDYMNKALTCQVCKLTINEVENVLVCDACEKGYHLKCLQSRNQKGIPRGEWHCFKCLSLSNGKPLPPKYGRVTRNIIAPKMLPNTAAVQSSPEKKVGTLGEKGNQKITANGNSGLQSAPAGSMGNNHNHSASGSNIPNAREMQGNDILSIERSCEEKLVSESKAQSPATPSETITKMLDHMQTSSNPQNNDQKGLANNAGIPSKQCNNNNLTVKDSERSDSCKTFDGNPNDNIIQEEQGVALPESVETSGTGLLASEQASSSSDGSNDVDWIGDVLQVVDEKTYYPSCCINGVLYKVQDHALFQFNNDKPMPSKLQAMWEDNKTRSKWVIVNRCYFPCDLPETVGRPCSPETNEVYESNHGSAMLAGLIRGPCEVLPPGKFIEESERRSRLGSAANDGLWPLFVCKWIYDESKGVFRDVSC